jgi:hypothetical protein
MKLNKNGGKVICIKTFTIGRQIENEVGEIYEYYTSPDEENGYWVVSKGLYSATFFDVDRIKEYFISLSEWREQQINSILDE